MAKPSPYSLKRPARQTFTRTFTNYADPRWQCACGFEFNEDVDNGTTPKCPKCKGLVVTENPPQLEFDMLLRKLSVTEQIAASDLSDLMIQRYVRGVGEVGKKGYQPPEFLPPVDNQPVYVTDTTCRVAAMIYTAQVAEDADRLMFTDIVSFMVSDSICQQMADASNDVQIGEVSNPDPLASAGSEAPSSPTPATAGP